MPKKDLADKAKETYAVKSPRFKKAIAQKNATASNPTATLKITGAVNELADFKYKDNTSTDAARGKVLKASGLKSLQKGNLKAFITKFGSGHVSVVQRKGTSRLPLKKLLSPSIPTMVGNEAKVYGIVKPNIEKEPAEEHPEADRQNTGRQVNDGADFTRRTCKGNRGYF